MAVEVEKGQTLDRAAARTVAAVTHTIAVQMIRQVVMAEEAVEIDSRQRLATASCGLPSKS